MLRKFTSVVLLIAFFAAKSFGQCSTTNYGTSQVISTNTTLNAGTYNVTGDFTVNAGVTLTINYSGNCPFTVNATNINILGTINANGAGYAGGAGGAGEPVAVRMATTVPVLQQVVVLIAEPFVLVEMMPTAQAAVVAQAARVARLEHKAVAAAVAPREG